ncbi:MAG: hypothetical protein FD167_5090, partial [bacterium]
MQQENSREKLLVCAIDIGTSSIRVSGFDKIGNAIPDLFIQNYYQMNLSSDGGVE